ncbi:MAG: cyclase family protein [Alphaproteobacteria bacterium]|nr:MAG: cyclase family protein [Alphaproteobacteria bacterium]
MTQVQVTIGKYRAEMSEPLDISIPVKFGGDQLSAFGSPPAYTQAYTAGKFVGDVRRGGSCNCEIYHFSPHLNGTHTECVGHITTARISLHEIMKGGLLPATLITVRPIPSSMSKDQYDPRPRPEDLLITAEMLKKALEKCSAEFLSALIIRTLPNDKDKTSRDYGKVAPPFFSVEAMEDITMLGVQHLLVDMPSVDRLDDEGKLTNHRIFWDVPHGSKYVDRPSSKTITELIYVPDTVPDGNYLLNLQIAAFTGDAAPSHPVLYKVTK